MRSWHLISVCFLVVWFAGCSEPTAGGSTDTETGALAGLATLSDGSRVANARVVAYPASQAVVPAEPIRQGISSSEGAYRLEGLPAGRWTLEFVAVDGRRGLLQDLVVTSAVVTNRDAVLHTPGRIRLSTSVDTSAPWVEGTGHIGRIRGGFWVVDSIPAGVPLVLRRGMGNASRIVALLALAPAQDTLVP
ncbi:MAG: carboxypeptidase regulatory-like domain-containing protein [Fibrobacterota bacterium]|nr:carboxypeptidase regulatory-like domain-containing protein [Fibrobacterota bacterium]QQS06374.1 MAG: carboxypeptidase regulatory-like domain-containing protein [Fibrobacterota bacterium]